MPPSPHGVCERGCSAVKPASLVPLFVAADGAPRRVEFRLELARYAGDEGRSLQQIVFGGG